MGNPDESHPPSHAFHGPLPDENLPPPQGLHGPLPDVTPHPSQALHGSLPDEICPSPRALHGPIPSETPPPPLLALHGPLPDETDPAWAPAATGEHMISRHSADDSFMSIFNWIRKRFNRRTNRPDSAGATSHSRSATFPRSSHRSSRLHIRDLEKGTSAATGPIDVQPPTTASADTTPASHTSADLKPAPDYAKMGETSSGSSNDPVLGHVTKVKDFIRQVNDLPWASTERVTIDYYPGQSKKRSPVQPRTLQAKGPRHVRSWYSERTSGLLPFTVVSPPTPLTTSHETVDQEVQLRDDTADASHPQGYVPPAAQQQLASQYADFAVHTLS
ncbi:hypothetical protein JOM56_004049 [Amanita muscaria]